MRRERKQINEIKSIYRLLISLTTHNRILIQDFKMIPYKIQIVQR